MLRSCILLVLALSCLSSASLTRADEASEKLERWKQKYDGEVLPIVKAKCLECHSGDKPDGEFDLAPMASGQAAAEKMDLWDRVAKRIRLNEMPPQGSPQLSDPEKGTMFQWLDSRPTQNLCEQLASDETQAWYQGYVMSRRLTRTEYANAIRDLVGFTLPDVSEVPSDGSGGEGFDTNGDALFTSTIHVEKYLNIADRMIEQALPDELPPTSDSHLGVSREVCAAFREQVLISHPSADVSETDAAKAIIVRWTRRVWRRPINADETDRLLQLFQAAKQNGAGFIAAIRQPLKAALVSPHFLFVVEPEPGPGGIQPLTPHQLATRLALFLWASIPDERLLSLADQNELRKEDVLRGEVRRMLNDSRARGLAESFGLQWLGLSQMLTNIKPDASVFPEFNHELVQDMREEVIRNLTHVFCDDRSLNELLNADYVWVNERLSQHYGLAVPAQSGWQKQVLNDHQRGGVITLGAVLASTAYPRRTSPVLRGRWILEEVLGSQVPPPPPNVPPLEEVAADATAQTLRKRLEVHRTKADCAGCHNRMDPLGFGLENFDALGRYRTTDAGLPVDASGQLPSGESFQGAAELKQVLLKRQGEFHHHFVRKLLGYALGRSLNKFDSCVIDDCLKQLSANEYRAGILFEQITLSFPFQHRYFKSALSEQNQGTN